MWAGTFLVESANQGSKDMPGYFDQEDALTKTPGKL
jgi:hypothetical protein